MCRYISATNSACDFEFCRKSFTLCVYCAELQHSVMTNRSAIGDGGQLYDNPYEERTRHHHRAAPPAQQQTQRVESGFAQIDSRESRLPQDDERPADEYDQPWEWKKDNISKALAGKLAFSVGAFQMSLKYVFFLNEPTVSLCLATVQFEGAERERSRAQTEQTRLTKTGTTSTTADSTTLRLVGDTPPLLGERVDPSLPLERQV